MSDNITLKISNLKSFNKALNKKLQENKVKQYVTRATMIVESTAKKSIQAGGTGKLYKRGDITHRASAPNNPPATDTGFLVSQITMDVDVKANGSVVGQIISSAPYSKALEFGTVNMQPRPFMQPALMKNKRKIQAMFKKGILK
jgi:HK97 gp10 family phage protein|tara:strand:- start:150 stop:581 length:432 start_codon:yes stop_codon:yes gene_type:complete